MTMNLSGELARTLLELAPDATVIVDGAGTIVFANAQMERTFGYAPTDLAGKPVEILLPSRFHAVHAGHRAEFAKRSKPRPMGEGRVLFGQHRDGREFPVEISLSPVDSEGARLVVAAIRDATVRHDTERGLVEANRAKNRLLAAASHDLRQPVQTLMLLSEAAARHAGSNAPLRQILERQQAALDNMSALLASALDMTKLDSGAVTPAIVDCAINDVFARLSSDFGPQSDAKRIALIVEPTDEGARTDPELLRRMLANLLSNAIRYTATGSVRLSCRRSGERLAITVRDTGAGIPARELGKIFEEFYQVDRGSQRPEGLGLGLSIVRRLAALLGHEVDVESTLGQGTAFTITVPRVALAASAARPTTKTASAGARGKVLVVDDEAAVAHATSLLLELEGFEVRIASCMSEALEMSRTARPDLIVSDYRLRGGETGAEVVNEIRRDAGAPIPAIFVTGDTGKVAAESATLAHTTLLGKPTRVEDLLAAIREHLGATIA